MITSREDFLMTFIGCGMLDLKLIDDVKYDWCDVFEYLDLSCCGERKLSAIMSAVFYLGKSRLEEAIIERIDYLEDTEKTYGISEEQKTELEELKWLDPYDDLEEYHNYIDTHITCVNHKAVYEAYLAKELEDFADGTGFEVEF